jgi:hypothetical protein
MGGHQPQRQLPPHLSGRRDEAGTIATNEVDPTFLKSVESLIESLDDANERDEHAAGPKTADTAGLDTETPPRSRTGSNRIDVNGRSLWDRMGSQRGEVEGEIGQEKKGIKRERERDEVKISTFSIVSGDELSKPDDGWAPSLAEEDEDGWGFTTPVEVGEGDPQHGNELYAHKLPSRVGGSEDKPKDDQWGKDGEERWDPYHSQSVRAEPGPASTEW